jgi:methylglyoxal synthase
MKTDQHTILMLPRKRIALVAHDNKKQDLLEWARFNRETLEQHDLYATGTTGAVLTEALGLTITRLLSGPLGVISRLALKSRSARSTSRSSSGIHWSRSRRT